MKKGISSTDSILLGLGDLKLWDTDKTFGNRHSAPITIDGVTYQPLDFVPNSILSGRELFVSEIICNEKKLYYAFSKTEDTDNAVELALGYAKNKEYFFVKESFGNLYSENPVFTTRSFMMLDDLQNPTQKKSTEVMNLGEYNAPSLEYHHNFANWQDYIESFPEPFEEQKLNLLRRVR